MASWPERIDRNVRQPGGAAGHSKVHGMDYCRTVNDRMMRAKSRDEAVEVLNHVRKVLLSGGL